LVDALPYKELFTHTDSFFVYRDTDVISWGSEFSLKEINRICKHHHEQDQVYISKIVF
jgi:hypothetical protein